MLDILVYLLVILIVFGAVFYVLRLLPLPEPIGTIANVVVAVILLLILLSLLLGGLPLRPLRL